MDITTHPHPRRRRHVRATMPGETIFRRDLALPATATPSSDGGKVFAATLATATPVERMGPDGPFVEVLRFEPGRVLVGRLNDGGPVLDAHRSDTVAAALGSVEPGSAQVVGNSLQARLRIAPESVAPGVLSRIEAGHLRGVSIGYRVIEWESSGEDERGLPIYAATMWEALEVSLTPIPADPAAGLMRSAPATAANDGPVTLTRLDELARTLDLPPPIADDLRMRHAASPFATEASFLDAARAADAAHARADVRIISRPSTESKVMTDPFSGRIRVLSDQGDHERRAIEDTVFARLSGTAPSEVARPFRNLSLTQLAERSLQLTGQAPRHYMSRLEVWQRATHVASDFSVLLVAGGQRFLHDRYRALETPLKRLCVRRQVDDFREVTSMRIEAEYSLDEVPEGAEIRYGTYGLSPESYRPTTFARAFAISLQALMNDDLGAFSQVAADAARLAARREADSLHAIIANDGPLLSDGLALFSTNAARLNKASAGSALDEAALSAARQHLRTVKDPGGAPMGLPASYLLVGPARETTGQKLLTAIQADSAANVSPFAGQTELLVEPRIPSGRFYVFSDPQLAPVLEYAEIAGMSGPQLESAQMFDRLGLAFRIVMHYGCGATGWRGSYLNPGN